MPMKYAEGLSEPVYEPEPDDDTPSQSDFIRRLAALPHTADGGLDAPASILELGGALSYLNQAIQVAREIVKRDSLSE